jgi:hypothetical protein
MREDVISHHLLDVTKDLAVGLTGVMDKTGKFDGIWVGVYDTLMCNVYSGIAF